MWLVWSNSVQRAPRVAGEKRKKKLEEDSIAVKPKAADKYVGRPNDAFNRHNDVWQIRTSQLLLISHANKKFLVLWPNTVELTTTDRCTVL